MIKNGILSQKIGVRQLNFHILILIEIGEKLKKLRKQYGLYKEKKICAKRYLKC